MLASQPLMRVAIFSFSFLASFSALHSQDNIPDTVSATPWRQVAHNSRFRSMVSDQILAARGAYSDASVDTNIPIDSPSYVEPIRSKGVPRQLAELPVNEADMILVGTFLDHDAYLSPSHKSVYTTIYVSPIRVLKNSVGTRAESLPLSLLTMGGTVKTDSGRLIRSGLNASTSTLTPGHKYLLFLKYHPEGNFFTNVKAWEFRAGKAFPAEGDDLDRSYRNVSRYSGQPESLIISAVSSKLAK